MKSVVKLIVLIICSVSIVNFVSAVEKGDANAPAQDVNPPAKDVNVPVGDANVPKTGTSDVIYSEGFEDRLPNIGWTFDNEDYDYVWDTIANEGKKSVKIKYVSWIQKLVSTAGYKDIRVKYARKTTNFDAGEELSVAWTTDGVSWNNLENTAETDWAVKEFSLGPKADNNANFRIKFKTNARGETDKYASVDAMVITGIPTGGAKVAVPTDSNKPASSDSNKPQK